MSSWQRDGSGVDLEGAKYSVISSLRTGKPIIDMIIAMLIPLAFKLGIDGAASLRPVFERFLHIIKRRWEKPRVPTYTKTISVKQMRNKEGYLWSEGNDRNAVLIKALDLYIADLNIQPENSDVHLTQVADKYESKDDDEEWSEVADLRKRYRLAHCVPENEWIRVESGVSFYKSTEEVNDKHQYFITTTMKLQGWSEEVVSNFIKKAYEWYLQEMEVNRKKEQPRYLYDMKSDGSDGGRRRYRRYKLADEKTFQSLFFPEKDTLVQLIHHFTNRTGKYEIPGYPHKLGLLLHGPPGTGKTSLIKVLAHHTGRSIVNVPLTRIETNSDLMDVIFDEQFYVIGVDTPVTLRIKDLIFVMEDVDAISKIVHKRSEDSLESGSALKQDGEVSPNELVRMLVGQGAGRVPRKGKKKRNQKSPSKNWRQEGWKDWDDRNDDYYDHNDDDGDEDIDDDDDVADDDEAIDENGSDNGLARNRYQTKALARALKKLTQPAATPQFEHKDKLSLAGILNVLDGVVDSPNRMLVMTTNHPEKLDPALIRPGRIDKVFLLTYMVGEQAARMIAHYFQDELSEETRRLIRSLVDGTGVASVALEITPARLEQLCAEHETVDSLCLALQHLSEQPAKHELIKTTSISVEAVLSRTGTIDTHSEAMFSRTGSIEPDLLTQIGEDWRRAIGEHGPDTSKALSTRW